MFKNFSTLDWVKGLQRTEGEGGEDFNKEVPKWCSVEPQGSVKRKQGFYEKILLILNNNNNNNNNKFEII